MESFHFVSAGVKETNCILPIGVMTANGGNLNCVIQEIVEMTAQHVTII